MRNQAREKPNREFNEAHFIETVKRYRGKEFKVDELAHKKSERTTFNLSKEAIDSLEWLASHAEVKVKEVIDQAIQRCMEILTGEKDEWGDEQAIFKKLTTPRKDPKTRKTYVISLGDIRVLNNLSSNFKIQRDMIMETVIIDYALFVKKSVQKRIQKYQLAYDKLLELGDMLDDINAEVEILLGEDDPIAQNVYTAMSNIVDDAIPNLKKAIEDGKPLKPMRPIQVTFR